MYVIVNHKGGLLDRRCFTSRSTAEKKWRAAFYLWLQTTDKKERPELGWIDKKSVQIVTPRKGTKK